MLTRMPALGGSWRAVTLSTALYDVLHNALYNALHTALYDAVQTQLQMEIMLPLPPPDNISLLSQLPDPAQPMAAGAPASIQGAARIQPGGRWTNP